MVVNLTDVQSMSRDDPRKAKILSYIALRKSLLTQPLVNKNATTSLAQDLQARQKHLTTESLQAQAVQYRRFNEDVLYLVEPEQLREGVKQRIRTLLTKQQMPDPALM